MKIFESFKKHLSRKQGPDQALNKPDLKSASQDCNIMFDKTLRSHPLLGEILYRRADGEDEETVRDILVTCAEELDQNHNMPHWLGYKRPHTVADLFSDLSNTNTYLFYLRGQPVCTSSFKYKFEEYMKNYITDFQRPPNSVYRGYTGVVPGLQGEHIGSKVRSFLNDHLKGNGVEKIIYTSVAYNDERNSHLTFWQLYDDFKSRIIGIGQHRQIEDAFLISYEKDLTDPGKPGKDFMLHELQKLAGLRNPENKDSNPWMFHDALDQLLRKAEIRCK